MRLITRREDGTLEFARTPHSDVPPYAILSHTWGTDDQELTFLDIANNTGKDKDGYQKLDFCAGQAAKDGLNHFWIDTCCIDKSNSTELGTAINSMFQWYRKAEKCYVYLTDVSLDTAPTEENENYLGRESWKIAFRRSRWMTRGWTLQELVAPRSVDFFSKEGSKLGDKRALEGLLHETTGISVDVLRGKPLADLSINERFSWLETRNTKIPEDRVYCMFGMFGVQLPLIYSEGEVKAMARLRAEIGRDKISDIGKRCIADLRITNPRDDKTRIEDTKGGLLADSYIWVLDDKIFTKWRDDSSQRLLWVKGDPGKGKTMLLCGIINHLESTPRTEDKRMLAYFFCQATDERINTATAVVRGLILMMLEQDSRLLCHIEKKYEIHSKALFDDGNAWYALSKILLDMLQDSRLESVWLVVDALDECTTGRSQLLDLIVDSSHTGQDRIKWLVSSRNWREIEERLDAMADKVSLEFNATSVAGAVESYINHKVSHLAQSKKYKTETTNEIRRHLLANADGTFLWVALVCQELYTVPRWKALQRVHSFPAGLDGLYGSMLLHAQDHEDKALCLKLVAVTTVAYIPLRLVEYPSLVEECRDMEEDLDSLQELIMSCGSFLTVRNETVYFVHQSAKDYIVHKQSHLVFPDDRATIHEQILLTSLQSLTQVLRRDIYSLVEPGVCISEIVPPTPDPLSPIAYACKYWIDHFHASGVDGSTQSALRAVTEFLEKKCLYWFESLSLLRCIYSGMISLHGLKQKPGTRRFQDVATEAHQVLQTFRLGLEDYPLQTYVTVLAFSPRRSLIRELFRHEHPAGLDIRSGLAEHWSTWELTCFTRDGRVDFAEFSPDDRRVISSTSARGQGSTNAVEVWNSESGACEMTLEGSYGAYSPDGRLIATTCEYVIKLWNSATGSCEGVLDGHQTRAHMVKFSPCSRNLVSVVGDPTKSPIEQMSIVKLWNVFDRSCVATFKLATAKILRMAFIPNIDKYQILMSGWPAFAIVRCPAQPTSKIALDYLSTKDVKRRTPLDVLEGGQYMLFKNEFDTVEIWNMQGHVRILQSFHHPDCRVAAFSNDECRVVSASNDTVKVWNIHDAVCETTRSTPPGGIKSVAFSNDGRRLVLCSSPRMISISGLLSEARTELPAMHYDSIDTISFSPDGQWIATVHTRRIRVWASATGLCELVIEADKGECFRDCIYSVDGRQIISGTWDGIYKLRDATTGTVLQSCRSANGDLFTLRPIDWTTLPDVAGWSPYISPSSYDDAATIREDNCWILICGRRSLWLPPDLRKRDLNLWDGDLSSAHVSPSSIIVAFATLSNSLCIIHYDRTAKGP